MPIASNILASSRPSKIQRKYKRAGRFARDLILAAHFDNKFPRKFFRAGGGGIDGKVGAHLVASASSVNPVMESHGIREREMRRGKQARTRETSGRRSEN